MRRSSKAFDMSSCASSRAGLLTSVAHSEVTLLEVYLHTEGLRTQIDALGNICNLKDIDLCLSALSFEDLGSGTKFSDFPIGGNLLTYLYSQLKKRGTLSAGSWTIQDEIRKVRSKATEDMLRSLPSTRIDLSSFSLEHKNIQSSVVPDDDHLQADHSDRIHETVSIHSYGDSSNDASFSATNLPLSQAYQSRFTYSLFGLLFSYYSGLYICRSKEQSKDVIAKVVGIEEGVVNEQGIMIVGTETVIMGTIENVKERGTVMMK